MKNSNYSVLVQIGKSFVQDLKKIRLQIAQLAEYAKNDHNVNNVQFAKDIGLTRSQLSHIMVEYNMAKKINGFDPLVNGESIMKQMGHLKRNGTFSAATCRKELNRAYSINTDGQLKYYQYLTQVTCLRKTLDKENSVNKEFAKEIKKECKQILNILSTNKEKRSA